MKNFNLISPSDNGFEYTIRFQDPIKIMKNSKIDFKFAELVRAGEVVLNEEQTITLAIENDSLLPRFNPNDEGEGAGITPATLSGNTDVPENRSSEVKIPAGVYSYTNFRTQLQTALDDLLVGTNIGHNLSGFAVNTDRTGSTQRDIAFGIQYDFAKLEPDPTDMTTSTYFSSNIDESNYGEISKDSGGVAGTLDSGAILNPNNAYIHRYYRNPAGVQGQNTQNFIFARGITTTEEQAGDIHIGLYNKAASSLAQGTKLFGSASTINPCNSDGRAGGDTSGNNYLRVFMGVRVEQYGGNIEVYMGQSNQGEDEDDSIIDWNDQYNAIDSVEVLASVPVHRYFEETQCPAFFIQVFQDIDDVDDTEPRSFFRVLGIDADPSVNASFQCKVVYDSSVHGISFPFEMEVGDGVNYGQAPNASEKAFSQMPYNVVIGMTHEGDGWSTSYPQLRLEVPPDDTCDFLATDFELTFTEGLAQTLNFPRTSTVQDDTVLLTPNFKLTNDETAHINLNAYRDLFWNSNISNPWRRDSYSIFIDLPCNNYKNLSDKVNGGFRKSVLANIPSPFASADTVAADNSNSELVATYEPYQPVQSELKNNEISVNSFKISIVDMKTEQLAKQLTASTVNFSIHCPSEEE